MQVHWQKIQIRYGGSQIKMFINVKTYNLLRLTAGSKCCIQQINVNTQPMLYLFPVKT